MTIQTINLGNYANDGTGDDLRTAFTKVNANFNLLSTTSNAIGGVNLGSGASIFADKNANTLNLEFKTITSNDASVHVSSTTSTVDLSVTTNLFTDPAPKLAAPLNLNTFYTYGGDTANTIYGYDYPVEKGIISTIVANNNLVVDMGSITAPTGNQHFTGGYTIDFNGTGIINGFANPLKNDYDFGSFISTAGQEIGGGVLNLNNNNFTVSGGSITLLATGSSTVSIPNSGNLAVTNNPLNQFALTSSSQLAGMISDAIGTGYLVFNSNSTLAGTTTVASLKFGDGSTLASAAGLSGSSSIINGSYTVTLQSNGILTVPGSIQFADGTTLSSTTNIIPTQGSSAGLFLTTNGTSISWANPHGASTVYIGPNTTTNSTLSIYGNTSTGTASLTTNVLTGTANIFAGVTGTINVGGITWTGANNTALIINNGALQFSSANSVAAAGTNQGTATQLYADNNFVTSGTGGVILPAATTGREVSVTNNTGASINVYPQGTHTIESGTGGTPTVLPNLATITVIAKSGNNWWTMQPVYNASTNIAITQSANGSVTWATTTTPSFSTITSTVATGTAPFIVASTTNVANLNASSLNGATFASPGAIGSTTSSTGSFTNLTRSGLLIEVPNYITVSSTNTYSLSSTTTDNILLVTAVSLTATLTFPSSGLVDGQRLKFTVTTNTVILALTAGPTLVGTFAGSVTAPTTFTYVYRSSNTTWYRI